MCSWNCGKFNIFDKEVLNLDLKTWILAGKWKCLFLCLYFMVCFVWSVDLSIFFWWSYVRSETINKLSPTVHQRKIKNSSEEYVTWKHFKIWRLLKIFRKSFTQFIQTEKYWQNKYSNMRTTCHIKLKTFLWIKPLRD